MALCNEVLNVLRDFGPVECISYECMCSFNAQVGMPWVFMMPQQDWFSQEVVVWDYESVI